RLERLPELPVGALLLQSIEHRYLPTVEFQAPVVVATPPSTDAAGILGDHIAVRRDGEIFRLRLTVPVEAKNKTRLVAGLYYGAEQLAFTYAEAPVEAGGIGTLEIDVVVRVTGIAALSLQARIGVTAAATLVLNPPTRPGAPFTTQPTLTIERYQI